MMAQPLAIPAWTSIGGFSPDGDTLMMTMIIGQPDSGKSDLAEQLVMEAAGAGQPVDLMDNESDETQAGNLQAGMTACLKPGGKYYIATMIPYGQEGQTRVDRHREMRRDKGFVTIEEPADMTRAASHINGSHKPGTRDIILLECLSNLVANVIFGNGDESDAGKLETASRHHDLEFPAGRESCPLENPTADMIARQVMSLKSAGADLYIVANHFEIEEDYNQETGNYIYINNLVNEILADMSDTVYRLEEGHWTCSRR